MTTLTVLMATGYVREIDLTTVKHIEILPEKITISYSPLETHEEKLIFKGPWWKLDLNSTNP